jgi:integrase
MPKHTGIRKLPNGRFRARYFRGYDAKTGQRVYPARTFDTERQAREWRASETAARGSNLVEGRGITLSGFLDHWLTTKPNIRENTRRTYQAYIETNIKPQLGQIKLTRLAPSHVERWQADLLETLSAQTVVHIRTVLRQAIKSAQRKNLIRTNPVDNTDGPEVVRPQRYPLSIEEAIRIIQACEGHEHGVVYLLFAYCGLRPEELIGLTWSDLELHGNSRGVLKVNHVVHHSPGGAWKFQRPKTRSSERVVKFPVELAGKLIEHRKRQLQQKLRIGTLWQDHGLVFANDIGAPLKRSWFAYRFAKLIKQLGLSKKITLYTLRHFFVTSSLIAGVDIKTVSREAGHSKVAFTMDVYGSVLDEMHDAAADKREQLFKNRKG